MELEDLKQTLSTRETEISELNSKLSEARGQLKGQGKLIEQMNADKASLLDRLSKKGKSIDVALSNEKEEKESVTTPLMSVGKRCLGEQHDKVISSQQHAIVELRKRVNDLMTDKPPGKYINAAYTGSKCLDVALYLWQ